MLEASGNIRSRSREAAKQIRRFIEEGIHSEKFREGDRLPTERAIAEQFSSGRNTVRKILDELEEEGLIVREVGRGTFIKQRPGCPSKARLSFTAKADPNFNLVDLSKTASPRDLMEYRLSIEPFITELAVERASYSDIEKMQLTIKKSRNTSELQVFEDLDDELHKTIAAASRNPLFTTASEIITSVRMRREWGTVKQRVLTTEMRNLHTAEHVEIVEAIARRDAVEARSAMEKHLKSVWKLMFGTM